MAQARIQNGSTRFHRRIPSEVIRIKIHPAGTVSLFASGLNSPSGLGHDSGLNDPVGLTFDSGGKSTR